MEWKQEPMADIKAFLTGTQVSAIINSASQSGGWQRDRDVLLLSMLAYTGRRIGEILPLRVTDILVDEKRIIFNILKKRKPTRKLKPINSIVFDLLMAYIRKENLKESDLIFASSWNKEKPISDARVRQITYKYALRANIPDFAPGKHPHPHSFRHSFAIAAAKKMTNPGDLRKLQMMLEHSKIDITTFYLQYSDEDQRELVDNLYK